MKLSKKAFIAAALLIGGMSAANAAGTNTVAGTLEVDLSQNSSTNYYVTDTGDLTLKITDSHTMFGRLFGAVNANNGNIFNSYANTTGTVTITGGGTLDYNGFSDTNLWRGTYTVNNGPSATTNIVAGKYEGLDSMVADTGVGAGGHGTLDVARSGFSGSVTVAGGTTLSVSGYLCQNFSVFYPLPFITNNGGGGNRPTLMTVDAGASSITLADNSTITFRGAQANLTGADGSQRKVNYLNNVHASVNSTIELGTDTDSTSRILIKSDIGGPAGWDAESTIGILSGTGRVFFYGGGNVSIVNQANFATKDDAGNIDISGTSKYADVYFTGRSIARLGTDVGGTNIVDNVLAAATAVQLGSRLPNSHADATYVAGTQWSATAGFGVADNTSVGDLQISGTQTLNNLQSLFVERERLVLEEVQANGSGDIASVWTYGETPSYVLNVATGATISVHENSTLVINQLANHDGVYGGVLSTTNDAANAAVKTVNDGVIVKSGAGTFVNIVSSSTGVINKLIVQEGQWIASVGSLGVSNNTRVIVSGDAKFRLISSGSGSSKLNARIEGSSTFIISRDSADQVLNEDGDLVWTAGIVNDGRQFLNYSNTISYVSGGIQEEREIEALRSVANRGNVSVLRSQDRFYGQVEVRDGMTLELGYGLNDSWRPDVRASMVYDLNSVFSEATGISLQGAVVGGEIFESLLRINSYQIVNNLSGASYTKLNLENYGTMVWNTQASSQASYTGNISGTGSIVKLGGKQLALGNNIDLSGSLIALGGGISLSTPDSITRSSGVVLGNGTSMVNGAFMGSPGSQSIGALVGEVGTTVNMGGGTLTVGVADSDRDRIKAEIDSYAGEMLPVYANFVMENNGYYFATYNGNQKYLTDLNLSVGAGLSAALNTQLQGSDSLRPLASTVDHAMSVDDTKKYLEDTGSLANAFSHLYATVSSSVYATMSANANWTTYFGALGATSLHDFLSKAFSMTAVNTFAGTAPAGWTTRQIQELKDFAESLEGDPSQILSDGCWTKGIYDSLKDVNAIRFLQEYYMTGLTAAQIAQLDTFYGFITLFDSSYRFQLTDANIEILHNKYGFNTSAITGSESDKYAQFQSLIDIKTSSDYGASFDGAIIGDGSSLVKIGSESLILTGVNTYTGATRIEGGELRVDWDAIQQTSGIEIKAGGLLTIVSDPTALDEEGNPLANNFIVESISGEGTILKDGDGKLTIVSALANGEFAGNIIVGKGQLQVNVNVPTGSEVHFASNIYINTGTEFNMNILVPATRGVNVESGELVIEGSINGEGVFTKTGAGTLILQNGDSLDTGASGGISVSGGDLKIVLQADHSDFRSGTTAPIEISEGSVVFDIATGKTVGYSGLITDTGAATVTTTFEKAGDGTLVLKRPDTEALQWTADNLKITAGTVEIATGSEYDFKNLAAEAAGTLLVNGTLGLDVPATAEGTDPAFKFAGTLGGTGNIKKTGAGELIFSEGSNIENFTGTFLLDEGSINISVADGVTAGYVFSIATSPAVVTGGTLIKSGAGTAVLGFNASNTNSIDASKISCDVREGILQVNGDLLTGMPLLLNIEKGATFEINPAATTAVDLSDIGELNGKGTLSLEGGATATVSANLNGNFTGIVNLGTGTSLSLDPAVDTFAGIGGTGTITVASGDLRIHQDVDSVFTGDIGSTSTTGTTLQIVGDGRLSLSDAVGNDATMTNINGIILGDGISIGGHVGVANDIGSPVGDITVLSAENCSVAITSPGLTETDTYTGSISIEASNTTIGLQRNGSIDAERVEETFNVTVSAGGSIQQINLSNYGDGTLTVKNLENIAAKVQLSAENGAAGTGTLAIETTGDLTLDRTISGTGNFEKTGSGSLVVSADQAYTGATKISAGTLSFDSGITLASNKLVVENGATLRNGITLSAANSEIVFVPGSNWEVDLAQPNSTLSYKGTASGTVDLKIENLDQSLRGQGVKIMGYIGNPADFVAGGTNTITAVLAPGGQRVIVDYAALAATGDLIVYVSQDHLKDVAGVDWHDGLDKTLDTLSNFARPDSTGSLVGTDDQKQIGAALNNIASDKLSAAVNNLSALPYAAMISMPRSGFANDASAVSARLEQRLYDNALPSAVWEYETDAEFFAQAEGTFVQNGDDSDSMVYDFNTYGAIAGMDVKFDLQTSAGFAVAYDHGKANVHDSGGKIEMDNVRATAFLGYLINDIFTISAGLQGGFASYDVKRKTIVGDNKGDANGWQAGAFADVYAMIPLYSGTSSGTNIALMPHVGISAAHFAAGSNNETGSASALDVDSFNGNSLQAKLGATLNFLFGIGEMNARVGFDVSLMHEFLDDEVDIDYKIAGEKTSVSAKAMSESALTLGPRFSLDFSDSTSAFLAYEFKVGTESETSHSVNIGFRKRF